MRTLLAAIAACTLAFAAVPVDAQAPQATPLYLGTEDGSIDGSLLLTPEMPQDSGDSATFSPAGPASHSWSTASPSADDLVITDVIEVTLEFGPGLDAGATTTVEVAYVMAGTATTVGTATQDGAAGGPPHTQGFEIDAAGTVLPEGSVLLLTVTVEGTAVVELTYGAGSESAIDAMPNQVLDTDGDGVGDSEERRQGSDPEDPSSTPAAGNETTGPDGNTTQGGDGSGADGVPPGDGQTGDGAGDGGSADDGAPVEPLIASAFLLLCLVAAGAGVIRRQPT